MFKNKVKLDNLFPKNIDIRTNQSRRRKCVHYPIFKLLSMVEENYIPVSFKKQIYQKNNKNKYHLHNFSKNYSVSQSKKRFPNLLTPIVQNRKTDFESNKKERF